MKKFSIIVLLSLVLVDLVGVSFVYLFGLFPTKQEATEEVADMQDDADAVQNEDGESYPAEYDSAADIIYNAVMPEMAETPQPDVSYSEDLGDTYDPDVSYSGVGLYADNSSDKKEAEEDVSDQATFVLTDKQSTAIRYFAAIICFCISGISACAIVSCVHKTRVQHKNA
jgi:hypothetical protein